MVMANLMPGSDVSDTAMTLVCLGCLTSDAKILSPSLPIIWMICHRSIAQITLSYS